MAKKVSDRRKVDKRYKDPPRYQFIYSYEKQFRSKFEKTLKDMNGALKQKLEQLVNES